MNLRWGIIGPGKIARKFADALTRVDGNSLYAVASREKKRAEDFAKAFSAKVAYANYAELAHDPNVDAVYVATPHSFHKEHTLLCLASKKPVLCEKPMSVNFATTEKMIRAARSNNTFLMEAFWTRFMPLTLEVDKLIQSGAIGTIKYVRADFGVKFEYNPSSRIFDLKLGGGSLLDVGVYPLFLVLHLLGRPNEIKSVVHKSPTGSDNMMSALFNYHNGSAANILSATNCKTPQNADIVGTDGSIHIPAAWWKSKTLILERDETKTVIQGDYPGNGYEFEIEEVQRCLSQGKTESDLLPLSFSLLMAEISESILRQHAITYST